MRNLHLILLQEDGVEVWRLFRLWEKLRLRASEYKNHRIFTLRCLHNDFIPTSIRLKSTVKSTRANKILRKAEKELLQTRVKSINHILDNTSQQLEECRSQLVAIIPTQRLKECQNFIDKVSESRFNKVEQRQLNKFNLLINRKEGNITRFNNTNPNNLNSQSNLSNQVSQANPHNPTLAIVLLPPGEGDNPSATGHLLREGTGPPQGNSQVISSQPNPAIQVIGNLPTLAIAHLPPREGSNCPPATVHPSSEGNSSPSIQASGSLPSLAIAHLPPGEGSNSLPVTVHPSSEGNSSPSIQASGSLPSPAIAHLPPREGSNSSLATVHPSSEGNSSPSIQASGGLPSPAIAHLPPGEGSNSLLATVHPSSEGNSAPIFQAPGLATAHLPPGEGSSSLPGASHLPSEDVSSSHASSLCIHSEGNSSPHPSSTTRAGQGHNPPRAGRQGNRHPPGTVLLSLPRRSILPPGRATPPHTPWYVQPRFFKWRTQP